MAIITHCDKEEYGIIPLLIKVLFQVKTKVAEDHECDYYETNFQV
jgi:hypothetical protein